MRRAASQENENGIDSNTSRPVARLNRSSHGSLYRKSLSLDQSMQGEQQQQIWKDSDAGSMSSMQSIDSEYGIRRGDSSMDSRLSAGSTQSDMPGRRKKKKGLMGKLRSLTKGSRGTESDGSVSFCKMFFVDFSRFSFSLSATRLGFRLEPRRRPPIEQKGLEGENFRDFQARRKLESIRKPSRQSREDFKRFTAATDLDCIERGVEHFTASLHPSAGSNSRSTGQSELRKGAKRVDV